MRSVRSVTDREDYNLYRMEYWADYKLDEIIEAGAGSTAEFSNLAVKTLLPGLPIRFDEVQLGCSACMTEDEDGTYHLGRNYDLDDTSGVMIHTFPENGYESIGFADLGFMGIRDATKIDGRIASLLLPYTTLDGMNEKGFGCCMLWLDDKPTVQDTGKTPITTTVALRLLLDRAANVEEGIAILASYDMRSVSGGDYHFYLVDRSGASAIVEWPEPTDEMTVTRDVKITTNFFVADVPEGVAVGHGQERAAAMQAYLDENGPTLTAQETMQMLKTAQQTVRTAASGVTQWSNVYDLSRGSVQTVFRRQWDEVFRFSFDET